MAVSNEDQLDKLFFALCDKSRRLMLLQLTKGELSVTELGEPLGQSKQLVSKHLKVLESAGLISKSKEGRVQRCRFNPKTFEIVQETVEKYRRFWSQQLDELDSYVTKIKKENKEK